MIPLKIKWAGLCTTDIIENEELFELMIESGCVGILMGFETFNEDSLKEASKKNTVAQYKAVVEKFHQQGVAILGTFMLGFDSDTKESIQKMPDYIEEIGVDVPRFAILTPYPNTPVFERLEKENRIETKVWSNYDSIHAVFRPKNCTSRELEELLIDVAKEVYSFKRIWGRTMKHRYGGFIKLMVNIGFKIYHSKVEGTVREGWKKEKK